MRTESHLPLLEVREVTKHFRLNLFAQKIRPKDIFSIERRRVASTVKAVDDVSFALDQGKTLGIVGETGCGKTTLLRTLIRLYRPDYGEIIFDGEEIGSLGERELLRSASGFREKVSMIFQDPASSLNSRMSVGKIIEEPLRVRRNTLSPKEMKEKTEILLEKVGLDPNYRNRYPHEFSGGQRQRIGIARSLALDPSLILCDEPVSALDVSIQSQILNLIMQLKETQNLSLIFISHDLSVVRHISDDVCVMYLGVVVEKGPSSLLYTNPSHPYTQKLLASIPEVGKSQLNKREAASFRIVDELPSPIDPPAGCRFHTRCPLVQGRCREDIPSPYEIEEKHFVYCHFADKTG